MSRKRGRDFDADVLTTQQKDDSHNDLSEMVADAVARAMKKVRESEAKNDELRNGDGLLALAKNTYSAFAGFVFPRPVGKPSIETDLVRIFGDVMNVEYEYGVNQILSSYPDAVNRYVIYIRHVHRISSDKLLQFSDVGGVFDIQCSVSNGYILVAFNHTLEPSAIAVFNILKKPLVSVPHVELQHAFTTAKNQLEVTAIADHIVNCVKRYFKIVARVNGDELPCRILKDGRRVCVLYIEVECPILIDQVKMLRVERVISDVLFSTTENSDRMIMILETVLPD